MNRRTFFAFAGGSAALLADTANSAETTARGRSRVSLNGFWEQWMAGQRLRLVSVPSSCRPLGAYELRHQFVFTRLVAGERAVLYFGAITYFARVFFNGKELGTMSAYIPYEFDVTGLLRERDNEVRVQIADLTPEASGAGADEIALGINPGWEGYSGIIREVWIELRPSSYIDNARLTYSLEAQYRAAACKLRVWTDSRTAGPGRLGITLRRAGETVYTGTHQVTLQGNEAENDLTFRLERPVLWSPDAPDLYDVSVTLDAGNHTDEFIFKTGFREFRTKGTAFELNGQKVILNGVNRHDIWKDQGFTLTREQMRQDMQDIKAMGINYVRLVHYPHHRYVIDLADELGLLVSEEPGYWQVNFDKIPRSEVTLGLTLLEKTIRRDWNSPSVVIWLLANECHLNASYLSQGKALCHKLDPLRRLVSAANAMSMERSKPIFEESGMDFFDTHPYTFDIQELRRIADFHGNSRPLTFTEWGGKEIGQSSQVMPRTIDMLIDLQNSGKLAGTAFWSWQDIPEFGRIDPEMRNGILESGVVTEARETRENIAMELRRLFAGQSRNPITPPAKLRIVPLRQAPWTPGKKVEAINLQALMESSSQVAAWNEFEAILAEYWHKQGYAADQWKESGKTFALWSEASLSILNTRFVMPTRSTSVRPLVLTAGSPELMIPIGRPCSRIHLLGQISCPEGYPILGELGSQAASLSIHYEGGGKQDIPLRHGYEIARGNEIFKSGRIDPIALTAQRAGLFVKDSEREHYQLLLFTVKTRGTLVRSVSYQLLTREQPILLFAVGVEEI